MTLPVCRACLSVDVRLHDLKESRITTAFETASGLSVDHHDRFPPYLCTYCCATVRRCVSFRRQCHMSQDTLELLAVSGILTLDCIKSVDSDHTRRLCRSVTETSQHIPTAAGHNSHIDSSDDIKMETFDEECYEVEVKTEDTHETRFEIKLEQQVRKENRKETFNTNVYDTALLNNKKIEHFEVEISTDRFDVPALPSDPGFISESIRNIDSREIHERFNQYHGIERTEQYFNYDFTTKQSLTIPRKRRRDRSFQCDFCGKFVTTRTSMIQHIRLHTGEKPYKCDRCEKTFSQACNLRTHIKVHTGEKPHKCEWCEKTFTQTSNLRSHRKVHTGGRPFSCDKCEKSFSHAGNLARHQTVHTEEKPFRCDTCGKSFAHSSYLACHKAVHSKEKPYECDACGKSITSRSGMVKHIRLHSGEKPFKCEICERSFAYSSHLRRHISVHTGQKEFKCDACDESFAYSSHLARHTIVHTGEEPNGSLTWGDIQNI